MSLQAFGRQIASLALRRALPAAWMSLHARRLLQKPAEHASRLLPYLVVQSEASLDVGANLGDYAWHLRALSAAVWAFEPNPVLAAWLRRCFGGSITVRNEALGEHDAMASLSIPCDSQGAEMAGLASIETDFGPQSRKIPVPVVRLDSLGLPRVGFIKVDVEGHELAALKGGAELLRREHPTILVEVEDRHRPNAVQSTRAWLEGIGYEGFFLANGSIRPIGDFSADRHQDRANLGSDAYINNFIFAGRQEVRHTLLHL
jgi:FkbM family methyltransferase